MKASPVVKQILDGKSNSPHTDKVRVFAPANIALCKYWGKRDEELRLPVTSSLSISLDNHGTEVELSVQSGRDTLLIDDALISPESPIYQRWSAYLDLVRPSGNVGFLARTYSSVPVGAGLASSASAFAALVLALNELFGWKLAGRDLSILARLGSGSACRSVFRGFVEWHAGEMADGMDSYAEPLPQLWPQLRLGLLLVATEKKAVSSGLAMRLTKETSVLYRSWPLRVGKDLGLLREAIGSKDFSLLGQTAETNALAMHATMLDSQPAILYWRPESILMMQEVWRARAAGLPIYFTMDAGPNLKLIFEKKDMAEVQKIFPAVVIVEPFKT